MGLADALNTEFKRQHERRCLMGQLLEKMSNEDREAFEIAAQEIRTTRLHSTTANQWSPATAASLCRALRAEGYVVSNDSVEKHVSQTCVCRNV